MGSKKLKKENRLNKEEGPRTEKGNAELTKEID